MNDYQQFIHKTNGLKYRFSYLSENLFMRLFFVILLALGIASCNNSTENEKPGTGNDDTSSSVQTTYTETPNVEITDPQNSCDPAKGLKWSKVLNGCVILVDLVTLHAAAPSPDPAQTAHLVFGSTRVEIFLPTQASSIVIRKSRDGSATWKNGPLKLSQVSGKFRLEDEGKLIYQQR